jgi:hypothetical protein
MDHSPSASIGRPDIVQTKCNVVEAHQKDAAIEQRPKSVLVVCFLHSAVFGCQRLAQPVLFFRV